MSALAGMGVTDAEIRVSEPELPALDGAAGTYAAGLSQAGLVEIGRATFDLFERVFFVEDGIRIGLSKGDGRWRFDFECDERWPHSQSFDCTLAPNVFVDDVAGARTFAFQEEVEALRAAGLAQGLDLTTALILGESGYVNHALWEDEPARHKLLDLIGDLYLSGVPPTLINAVSVRSGHRTNVQAAVRLAQHAHIERLSV